MNVGNLQGLINGNETVVFDYEVADSNAVLMLHMDGSDGGTTFTDNARARTPSAISGVTTSTTSPKFGSASALFAGGTSYLKYADNADFDFGSRDFTVDFWAKFTALPGAGTYAMMFTHLSTDSTNGYFFGMYPVGGIQYLQFGSSNNSANVGQCTAICPVTPSTGIWYHFAVVRGNGYHTIYMNGLVCATVAVSTAIGDATDSFNIGDYFSGNPYPWHFSGYIDEFRVSNGIARWTADFSASLPSAAYNYDPVSSISTGNILNGDVDGWYTIIERIVAGGASCMPTLQFNGDAGANYGWRGIQGGGAVSTAVTNDGYATQTSIYPSVTSLALGEIRLSVMKVYAKSGAVRLVDIISASKITGTTVYEIEPLGGVWNNTASNLTSIALSQYNGTSVIGVGSRIIILKNNNLLTSGTPTGTITTPYLKGSWVRVGSTTLTTTANSISFTGLNGDRDTLYYWSESLKASTTSDNRMRVNNYSATTVYGMQCLLGESTVVSAFREAYSNVGFNLYSNGMSAGNAHHACGLLYAKTGFARPGIAMWVGGITGTTVVDTGIKGLTFNDTTNNIVSLDFNNSSGQWAAGTTIDLYALRPNG
jgi:hypothetical protein